MKKAINYFVIFVMTFIVCILAYRWGLENGAKIKNWLKTEDLDEYFRSNLMRVIEGQVKSMIKIKWTKFRKDFEI